MVERKGREGEIEEKVGRGGVGGEKRGRRSGVKKKEKKRRKGGGEGRMTAKKGGLSCTSPQEIGPLMFTN